MSTKNEIFPNKDSKKKELKGIVNRESRFLGKILSPILIDEHNNAKRALYFFPPIDKKTLSKLIYLNKERKPFTIQSTDPSDINSLNFEEIYKNNEIVRDKLLDGFAKRFAREIDKHEIVKELCGEYNYGRNCVETLDFEEIEKEDPRKFFTKLYKYIEFLVWDKHREMPAGATNNKMGVNICCGSEKEILLITNPKFFGFIKQNDTNNFLQNLIGNIICADLENDVELILIANWGILVPYDLEISTSSESKPYLIAEYNVNFVKFAPSFLFKRAFSKI